MDNVTYAYLAGAIDSDGSITMKRSTYHMRVRGDAKNPVYSERILLTQVTPHIPELLCEVFGGGLRLTKGQTENSKPLYCYECRDVQAFNICKHLLPYLRIKKTQAEVNIELRESKQGKYKQLSYWFEKEYPDWRNMEKVTVFEAWKLLEYDAVLSVNQAIHNGTLLAVDGIRGKQTPRIPKKLIEMIIANGGTRPTPSHLIQWQTRLYESIRELNKIGVYGTKIYRREGYHANKE